MNESKVPGRDGGIDNLVHQVRPARGEPAGALVLLHGRGTSEMDLLPLLDELDPEQRLVGVTPRAPLTLPPGGYHWYVVPRVGYPDPETFRQSFDLLGGFLDALPDAIGVPRERTVLGGFSMGAVMSYALGLGQGRIPPAAILAFSGFIPTVEGFDLNLEDRAGYPIVVAHGTLDPVIPIDFAQAARDRLQAAGLDVEYHESPMPHTIDPRVVAGLRGRLVELLPG